MNTGGWAYAMHDEHDYYAILDVPRDASDAEIRRAFRALAKEHHPDSRKEGSAGRDFRLISEAYETLKDPARRAAYDDELSEARQLGSPEQNGKRSHAFAAGLGVGISLALVAVGAVTYLGPGRRGAEKAQDSLKSAILSEQPAASDQKIPAERGDLEPRSPPSSSSPSEPLKTQPAVALPRPQEAEPPQIDATAKPPAGEPNASNVSDEPEGKTYARTFQDKAPAAAELIEVVTGQSGHKKTLRLEPGKGSSQSFTDCSNCPEMVVIPNGQSLMGSRPESDGYRSEEAPVHRIHILRPLAISKNVISAGNWRACVDAGVCRLTLSSLLAVGPRVAATRISWIDAKAYVDWLSQTTGWRYRLLTEAEWEYVARAGSARRQPEEEAGGRHPADTSKDAGSPSARLRVSGGGNAWGLQGGDVLEWVEDCWHGSYDQAPDDGSPWLSDAGGDCAEHVVRGNASTRGGLGWRLSARAKELAETKAPTLGFRVAREVAAPAKTALEGNENTRRQP